jgi:hypothetical protein
MSTGSRRNAARQIKPTAVRNGGAVAEDDVDLICVHCASPQVKVAEICAGKNLSQLRM